MFLTGIDGNSSNLSVNTADANVIFLDGTMATIKVKMDKSDLDTITAGKNWSQINAWCTYTEDKDGNYTLNEVAVSGAASAIDKDTDVAQYAQDVSVLSDAGSSPASKTISKKYVSLASAYNSSTGLTSYVYGNDDSVYINVELKNVVVHDESNGGPSRQIIDDVESITTGVKNANLVMENLANENGYRAPAAEIYTLYNDDGYVIAAVTIGENDGASSSYAYITSSQPNREAYDANTEEYTWTREAVVNGEIVELTEVGDTLEYLSRANMKQGEWYEIKYDADGNVRKVVDIDFSVASDKYENTVAQVEDVVKNNDTVLLADTTTVNRLEFKNGTLYTSTIDNRGFSVSPDVKVVLALADKTGSEFDDVTDGYTGYNGLQKALRDLNANAAGFTLGSVEVSAILESGVATSIVINDTNASGTTTTPVVPGTTDSLGVTVDTKALSVDAKFLDGTNTISQRQAVANALSAAGVKTAFIDMTPGAAYAVDTDGRYYVINVSEYFSVTLDGTVVDYVLDTAGTDHATKDLDLSAYTNGTGYLINGSYHDYDKVMTAGTTVVAANTVIETGYVETVISTSSSTWGTTSVTGVGSVTFSNGSDTYFALKDGQTISFTTNANAVATTGGTVELVVTGGNGKTVTAAQHLTLNEVKAGKPLSFTISGDITSKITKIAIKVTDDVATYEVKDPVVADSTSNDFNGLTVRAYCDTTNAKAGDTVIVTVTVSGKASADTYLNISGGTSPVWDSTTPNGTSGGSSAKLKVDNGTNFLTEQTILFSFEMTAGDVTPTVTVANS